MIDDSVNIPERVGDAVLKLARTSRRTYRVVIRALTNDLDVLALNASSYTEKSLREEMQDLAECIRVVSSEYQGGEP